MTILSIGTLISSFRVIGFGNHRIVVRACFGVFPVQRLNAWVKALTSWYPNSHAIVVIGR
jgi:hypothetical protein